MIRQLRLQYVGRVELGCSNISNNLQISKFLKEMQLDLREGIENIQVLYHFLWLLI